MFFDYSKGLFMDNGVPYDFPIWYEIPEGTDIQLSAIGEAETQVSAILRCILKDNNTLWADAMHESWKWIVRSCFGTIYGRSELG